MKRIISEKLFYTVILAFVIFSFVLIYIATHWGIGLTPDSLVYIRNAESLMTGTALNSSQHYPPLYSLMISPLAAVLGNTISAARWIQILVFISTLISLAAILNRVTSQGKSWILIGVFLIFTSPRLFSTYVMAWSEGLYILLTLLGFYYFAIFTSKPEKSALILSAGFFALALLTRYIGVVAIGTAILGLIFFLKQHWIERLKNTGIFIFLSLAPALLWVLWGVLTKEFSSPRTFAYHPISLEKIISGFEEILSRFFLSSTISWVLFSVFIISYIYLTLNCQADDSKKISAANNLKKILFLFVFLYLLFLVISISFFDAHTPLDTRILTPAYFFLIIAMTLSLSEIKAEAPVCKAFNIPVYLIVLFLCIVQIVNLQALVAYLSANGAGFHSRQWVESDTLAFVRKSQGSHHKIYTNSPEIIEIHLKRKSEFLPQRESATSKITNKNFTDSFQKLQVDLQENDAIIVYFAEFSYRNYLISLPELSKDIELDLLYRSKDGIVLKAHK